MRHKAFHRLLVAAVAATLALGACSSDLPTPTEAPGGRRSTTTTGTGGGGSTPGTGSYTPPPPTVTTSDSTSICGGLGGPVGIMPC
jgi:ABC-type glycerol-3-phosphate transport system substrate-binding protein